MVSLKSRSLMTACLALVVFCTFGVSQALAQEAAEDLGERVAHFPLAVQQPAAGEDDEAKAEGEGEVAAEGEGEVAAEGEEVEGEEVEEALEPIPATFDFDGEELEPHWSAIGMEAVLGLTREPGQAHTGQGALVLRYMPAEGSFPLVRVGPLEVLEQPSALEFALRTDELSSIRYAVEEQDGSTYEGYCYSPAGEWIDVRAALGEMILAQDSEDENGNLDAEQIAAISVMDLCNLPGEVGRALGVKQGLQRMWLDDVKLAHGIAPLRSSQGAGGIIVDDFDGDVACFLPIGAPEVQFVAGPGAGDNGACKLIYRLGGHRWVGLVRAVGHLDLAGFEEYCVKLNAQHRARLVAVLEEWDGSKYQTNVELDPETGWVEVALPITQLILDPGTDDENRQLDLDQVRVSILVVDTFNASVNAMGEGSLTISRISFR